MSSFAASVPQELSFFVRDAVAPHGSAVWNLSICSAHEHQVPEHDAEKARARRVPGWELIFGSRNFRSRSWSGRTTRSEVIRPMRRNPLTVSGLSSKVKLSMRQRATNSQCIGHSHQLGER